MNRLPSLILAAVLVAGPASAGGDAEHGKTLFSECAACHTMDPEQSSLGPHLKGVIGRKAGAVESYL